MKEALSEIVYVEVEDGFLKLSLEDGRHVIYLDADMFYALARFFDRAKLDGYEPEACSFCGRLP
jgi:hypothetical protein